MFSGNPGLIDVFGVYGVELGSRIVIIEEIGVLDLLLTSFSPFNGRFHEIQW